jgi:hypothetical protein
MEKICNTCGQTLPNHSAYANHIRWYHKDNTEYVKKVSAALLKNYDKKQGEIITEEVCCEKCLKKFEVSFRESKRKEKYYCSRSCANSRGPRTPEFKKTLSDKIKKMWTAGHYDEIDYTSINKRFSSQKEREIIKYFKEKYPDDNWTSGGRLIYEDTSITRDMYSDKLKVCFEYDGIWHFKDIHGQLKDKQRKDNLLEKWCMEKQYRLIRIEDGQMENIEQLEKLIYESLNPLIKVGPSYDKLL